MLTEQSSRARFGVYDISIDEYHGGDGVSRSGLMHLEKSPLHYWYNCLSPDKPVHVKADIITVDDALDFGNALHTYILEPDEFDNRYTIVDKSTMKKNTKIGKLNYEKAKAQAELESKELIADKAYHVIKAMSASINTHPQAPKLIEGAQFEKSIYWTDDDTGILCKIRPDIWQPNFIADLKTTKSAKESDFQRSINSFGYHIQAGMIKEGFAYGLNEDMKDFIFIAVEKVPPYASAVYKLDYLSVEQGVKDFKKLLQKLKIHQDVGTWPSYPNALISLPNYAFKD